MKVAIISDTHDNLHNLVSCLEQIKKDYPVGRIIFLGDFIANGVAKILASSEVPVFSVWGNNDGDKVAIMKTSLSPRSNLVMGFDTYDFLEIEGRKIFLTHYPILAKPMAKSGDFDAIFYGHDHKKNKDRIGDCLVLNPGELSTHKTGLASFAIYDTEMNDAEIFEVVNSITTKTKLVEDALKDMKFSFSNSKAHRY